MVLNLTELDLLKLVVVAGFLVLGVLMYVLKQSVAQYKDRNKGNL